MNSRERRILHLALRDETDVRSESVGDGSDPAGGGRSRGHEDSAGTDSSAAAAAGRRPPRHAAGIVAAMAGAADRARRPADADRGRDVR